MIDYQQIASHPDLKLIGKNIIFRQSVTSTNRVLYKMAENSFGKEEGFLAEGTILIAEEQTAGRGRLDRIWISPRGKGLWFSAYLLPDIPPEKSFLITFLGAVAVAEAVNHLFELKSMIKWPNDVLVKGRKYCGILTDTRVSEEKIQLAILGIGMNLNQTVREITESYGPIATSLRIILHRTVDPAQVLTAVLLQLDKYYAYLKEGQWEKIIEKWKEYATFLGSKITIVADDEPFDGIARDIDDKGGIIIELEDGEERVFYSGDLFL